MPKRGDVVQVDGNLALYVGEADHYDDTGSGAPGALVHVFQDATVVPAGSVVELGAAAPAEPATTEALVVDQVG